jgi:hypothetical protein
MTPSGPYSYYWPNGYPERVMAPTAPRVTTTPGGAPVGTGVRVWVADTGLAARAPGVLTNTTPLTSADNELPNRVANQGDPKFADYPHAGHLLAIAGSTTVTAPGVTINALRVNQRSGLLTDVDAARRIASAMRSTGSATYGNLLILSFGSAACDLDPTMPGGAPLQPVGTEAVVEVVDKFDTSMPRGMLVVASAGNVATSRPHYPAAFPSVLSVGALDATVDDDGNAWSSRTKTAPIAEFSNTGAWVDVYGPGVDLATNHVTNIRFEVGGDLITGAATVDGTSYAGPIVAGYLAEQMSVTGSKVRVARDVLINTGVAPLPKCGSTTSEPGRAIIVREFDASIGATPLSGQVAC